ncbi:hypothetical protein N431DRAFT_467435 [Stipitochalara longipes BDJ]|nr:hypothetical protein N431DRAFT_467435 [Stipitochalara longipes BDJ]
MSSSHHPRPPSSSSSMSQQSDDGQPRPSRGPGIPFRPPPSSGSSSSGRSHQTEVAKPGPSQAQKTSTPSGALSFLEPALGVGPKKSYSEINRVPLHWQAVEKLSKVEREAAIIKRANCYTQTVCPPGIDHVAYTEAIEDARGRGMYSENRTKYVEFPNQELVKMFPIPEAHSQSETRDQEQRGIFNPDAATVRKNFNDVRNEFQKSKLCVELRRILSKSLSKRTCNKIIAFGAGSICPPYEPIHHISKTCRNQHAALLVIRDVLLTENTAVEKKIEIFLQGPSYTRLDYDVLKEYGMIVVDGSIGCQMGFTLIDKETLIVDFNIPPFVFPLFIEIDRPVAILRGTPFDKEHYIDAPIKDTTLHHDSKEVIVPASDTNMWASINTLLQDYATNVMNVNEMNIGDLNAQPSEKPSLDGYNRTTYIGAQPTLYTRTIQTESDDYPKGWGPGIDRVGFCILDVKVPEYGIRREPLKWRELLDPENRAAYHLEIIKRVNLISYVAGLIFCDLGIWRRCKREAKETGRYGKTRSLEFNDHPDLEKIAAMYKSEPVKHGGLRAPMMRDAVIAGKKSELCRRIKELARKLFKAQKVTKIVAFGLGQISTPSRDPHFGSAVKNHYQHGALLAIRDTWKETQQGDFKIYVQDPAYSRQYEAILKQWGITVVNAEMGYQVGACLLDIFTLVVDFIALWPVSHVTFEITRPAGILKSGTIEVELEVQVENEAIFHYRMAPPSGLIEYKPPVKGSGTTKYQRFHYFPGTGVSDTEVIKQCLKDYRREMLDLAGLDLGDEYLFQRLAPLDPALAAHAKEAAARNEARHAAAKSEGSKGKKTAVGSLASTKLFQGLKGKASSSGASSTPHAAGDASVETESIKGKTNIWKHILKRFDVPESQRDHDYDDPVLRRDGSNAVTWIGPEPVTYTRLAKAEDLLR